MKIIWLTSDKKTAKMRHHVHEMYSLLPLLKKIKYLVGCGILEQVKQEYYQYLVSAHPNKLEKFVFVDSERY